MEFLLPDRMDNFKLKLFDRVLYYINITQIHDKCFLSGFHVLNRMGIVQHIHRILTHSHSIEVEVEEPLIRD